MGIQKNVTQADINQPDKKQADVNQPDRNQPDINQSEIKQADQQKTVPSPVHVQSNTDAEKPWTFQEELFPVEELYCFVEQFARKNGLEQTSAALPFMKTSHAGQVRKGPGQIPYIYHPLTMARHSIAMGLTEDALLAAILLHDVCEDCGVKPEALPVNETVREAVVYLTFQNPEGIPKAQAKGQYLEALKENRLAAVIKLLDRCSNVSAMAGGFTRGRIVHYITETETYLLPLIEIIKNRYPEYDNAMFLIKYQMGSVLESLKHMLEG